jgi:hypothetical protein
MAEFYTDDFHDESRDSRDRRSLWARMKKAVMKPFRSSASRAAEQIREGAQHTASYSQMRRHAGVDRPSQSPHEFGRGPAQISGQVRVPDLVSFDRFSETQIRAGARRYGRTNDHLRATLDRQVAEQVISHSRNRDVSPLVHPLKVPRKSIVGNDGIHSREPTEAERAEQSRLDAGHARVEHNRAAFEKGRLAIEEMRPRHPEQLGRMHLYPDRLEADLDHAKAVQAYDDWKPRHPRELDAPGRQVNEFGEVVYASASAQHIAENYHRTVSEIGARTMSRPQMPEAPELGHGGVEKFQRDVDAFRGAQSRYASDMAHYKATESDRHPFEKQYRQETTNARSAGDPRRAAMVASRPGRGAEALGI